MTTDDDDDQKWTAKKAGRDAKKVPKNAKLQNAFVVWTLVEKKISHRQSSNNQRDFCSSRTCSFWFPTKHFTTHSVFPRFKEEKEEEKEEERPRGARMKRRVFWG